MVLCDNFCFLRFNKVGIMNRYDLLRKKSNFFMCVAVCFVVLGCLSLARLADKIGLSRFLVGKECLLNTDLSHEITFSLKRGFALLKDILL